MRNFSTSERRSPRVVNGSWGSVTACLMLCWLLQQLHLWSPSGAVARQRSYLTNIVALTTSLQRVEVANQRLEHQLDRLHVDPHWVEAQARYRLNYVKPHETLFVYPADVLSDQPLRAH